MKSCDKIKKLAFLYNDHALESTQHAQIKDHLDVCPTCSAHFTQARQIKKSLQHLPRVRTAPDFNTVLRARLRSESARRTFYGFDTLSSFWRMPAYAAVALFFVAIGMMVQRHWISQPLQTPMAANVSAQSAPPVVATSTPVPVAVSGKTSKRPRVTNYVSEPVVPASDLKRWIRRNGLRGQGSLERLNGDSTGNSGVRETPQPMMVRYQEQF